MKIETKYDIDQEVYSRKTGVGVTILSIKVEIKQDDTYIFYEIPTYDGLSYRVNEEEMMNLYTTDKAKAVLIFASNLGVSVTVNQ